MLSTGSDHGRLGALARQALIMVVWEASLGKILHMEVVGALASEILQVTVWGG